MDWTEHTTLHNNYYAFAGWVGQGEEMVETAESGNGSSSSKLTITVNLCIQASDLRPKGGYSIILST